MKGSRIVSAVLTVIALSMVHSAIYAETDLSKWSHRASIEIVSSAEREPVKVFLSPEILDLAKPDLSDLRVIEAGRAEIGYVIRTAHRKSASTPVQSRLYNRTHLPKQYSAVTVDFGSKVLKNHIEVHTGGTSFKRRVQVEGSDDGVSWEIVRRGALLFRVQDEARKKIIYDAKSVDFPENDWQYLRVTVFNDPEDTEVVEIDDVKASRNVATPAQTEDVPIQSVSVTEKNRGTEIYLDLGYRNLSISTVDLRFSDANFFRDVTVSGRNAETVLARTPVEDSPALEKRTPAPWHFVKRQAIYRYTGGRSAEQSLSLDLNGAKFRYLRIRIENRDDASLSFDAAIVTRLVQHVVFLPKQHVGYSLYFGNATAQAPAYDVRHYIDRLPGKAGAQVRFIGVEKNPGYASTTKPVPWSERHQGLIWVALLVMGAVLALVVFRVARSVPKAS